MEVVNNGATSMQIVNADENAVSFAARCKAWEALLGCLPPKLALIAVGEGNGQFEKALYIDCDASTTRTQPTRIIP